MGLSLCRACWCATKTTAGLCGKCGAEKGFGRGVFALRKYDPSQPRDEDGRWTSGGSTAPGAGEGTDRIGRSDGTGFRTDTERRRAKEFVAAADAQIESLQRYEKLKKLKVEHLHVHNADTVPDAGGKSSANGAVGQYLRGRIDVALSAVRASEAEGLTPGGFSAATGARNTFLHEIGHYVHDSVLTKKAQGEWLGLWRQYGGGSLPRGISLYAASSHREMFAESFAVHVRGGALPAPVRGFLDGALGKRKAAAGA